MAAAAVTAGLAQWVTRELNLVVASDNTASVLDTGEYLAAVQGERLTPAAAALVLTTVHQAVNGILSCGTLDALPDVTLEWRDPH